MLPAADDHLGREPDDIAKAEALHDIDRQRALIDALTREYSAETFVEGIVSDHHCLRTVDANRPIGLIDFDCKPLSLERV